MQNRSARSRRSHASVLERRAGWTTASLVLLTVIMAPLISPAVAAPATPVQVAAPEFISKIQQQLDSSEFGGAWIVTTTAGEVVHVGLTSPDAGSLAIVAAAAAEYGLSNSYTTDQVRYSAEQLDGFYSQIQSIVHQWPSAEGLLGFGVRTELNKVELLLTSSQPDLVNTITDAVPADALQVTIVPGATVNALET